jgi:hypothetical protein
MDICLVTGDIEFMFLPKKNKQLLFTKQRVD